ncbi:iron-sulfur cluster assembly scaffold protein [uncultured Legionella sp.]|uniref:iron-sulfur cluster assembly scaffold protein n=1 Tax=uncultured Legionella sp. TaxID=210934 RepID=UPI002609A7C1|nr:iron-sulfur cluster assembly scaffold protein [uncultured Legionella sp.]
MMYNKVVEDCFFHPEHVGVLEASDPLVAHYSYKMMHQKTISMIELYIECSRDGLIRTACFKSNGNPYVLAALEWLCQNIEGTNLDSPPSINYQVLINVLDIPNSQYPVALVIEDVYKETLALMQKNITGYKS